MPLVTMAEVVAQQGLVLVDLQAGAPFGGQRALMLQDGRALPADPTAEDYCFAGVSTAAAAQNAPVRAAIAGLMRDPSWSWTPCDAVYVGPAGALTHAMPTAGWLHAVGVAVSSTALLIAPRIPILRAP